MLVGGADFSKLKFEAATLFSTIIDFLNLLTNYPCSLKTESLIILTYVGLNMDEGSCLLNEDC